MADSRSRRSIDPVRRGRSSSSVRKTSFSYSGLRRTLTRSSIRTVATVTAAGRGPTGWSPHGDNLLLVSAEPYYLAASDPVTQPHSYVTLAFDRQGTALGAVLDG